MRLRLASLRSWSLMAMLALVTAVGFRATGHGTATASGNAGFGMPHLATGHATLHQAADTRAARPLLLAELCEEEVEDRERHRQDLPVHVAGQGGDQVPQLLHRTAPSAPCLGAEHAGLPARHLRLRVMRI